MGDLAPDGKPYSSQERASFEHALSLLSVSVIKLPPQRIDIATLVQWHKYIAAGCPKMLPGTLRTSQRVRMGERPVSDPEKVLDDLHVLMRRLNQVLDTLDAHLLKIGDFDHEALEFLCMESAKLHAQLVAIHPFMDGNGRISRLAQAWMLARYGFKPPEFGDRIEYLSAINEFHDRKNITPLAELTLKGIAQITHSDDNFPN